MSATDGQVRTGRGGRPGLDPDPRRQHWTWEWLAERRQELCEGLAGVAASWQSTDVRHELELAVCVTDVWRRVDALLGEYMCAVWYVLLELRDADPGWRCATLERELSPSAHPVVETALAAARAVAQAGPAHAWDGGAPEVRHRLDEVGAALHRLALGELVPDVLGAPCVRPSSVWWSPPESETASGPPSPPDSRPAWCWTSEARDE